MTARHYRILTVAPALVAGVVLAVAPAARAHHSTAPFDTTQTISIEGVVSRYEWANPHVYIWLAAPAENGETVEWEVEAQPAAILRRVGWSRETFNVGDAIEVTGNPARNERRKKLLLVSLKRADTILYDGKTFMSALTTAAPAPAPSPDGIAGVWVTLLDMDAMRSYLNPAARVPLTESGAAAQADFDESTMSPGLKCIPVPAPAFMFAPDIKLITLDDGLIRIAGEFAAAERVIRLADAAGDGATAAPPSSAAEPSVQGNSVGRWDGETLFIETTDFAPHAAGLGFTLASSPEKRLVERLTVAEGGTGLTYEFELTDPKMLGGPITGGGRWVYRPDLQFAPEACNLENARRFVE